MKSGCFALILFGCVSLPGGPREMRSVERDTYEPLQHYEAGWRVSRSTPEKKTPGPNFAFRHLGYGQTAADERERNCAAQGHS